MNKRIEKINFKVVVIVYLVSAIIIGCGLLFFTYHKYQNKISYLREYSKISETFEKKDYDKKAIINRLDKLSQSSNDVVSIMIIDKNHKITYTTNNQFNDQMLLQETNRENYYLSQDNNLYHVLMKHELIITTILTQDYNQEYYENDDSSFYSNNLNVNKSYDLSYSMNNYTGDRIYYILDVQMVDGGAFCLKIDFVAMAFYFMLYWVIVALMIYQNALKVHLNPYLWGGITLLTNIIGVIIYLIYKYNGTICRECHSYQNKNHVYCTHCGSKLHHTCPECHHILHDHDEYCPNCGEKRI